MKLLCLSLLVLLGHQALTNPGRMERQPFTLKPVPAENIKDGERLRSKDMPQDILSYRQHGFHPANSDAMKLQCVWNAMNTVSRHLPQIVTPNNVSSAMINVRELCSNHAYENCGLDMNEKTCDPKLEYRSIDGTCNNLNNTRWGSATQPFERFVHSDYGDGVSTFRRSQQGKELPNPRKISRILSNSTKGEQPQVTLMLMQWGQFLDHDITLTPEREVGMDVSVQSECVDGAVAFGSQCLYFVYKVAQWSEAVQDCESKHARLATIDNLTDVTDYMSNIYELKRSFFWTGGTNAISDGRWTWKDGKPLDANIPWGPLQPNGNTNSQCLATVWYGGYYDYDCNDSLSYICEAVLADESSTMECCNEGLYENSISLGNDCVPINVTGDSFYKQDNRQCIRFVRSVPALRGCEYSPMEQINRNTAFVDGSMVYGSDTDVAKSVRTGERGLLNTTGHVGTSQPLPPRGGDGFAHQCPPGETNDRCFLAGDDRVDEIPSLTAMHTTFIRLHNIIADELCELNPGWCNNDEKLFQETRRIIIALIQQITYRDWLPLVVGQTIIEESHLNLGSQGYSDTYDTNVNPTMRNVFATAAFRFGHSLIADVIKAAKQENNLKVPGNFFNIHAIENITTSPSSLLKGLTRCPSSPIDAVVEPSFTNNLFADEPAEDGNFYGLDLVSLNIQRGRDHGIPGYGAWRRFCGLEDVKTFNELKEIMPDDLAEYFEQIYHNIDDIDLFPAGLAESPIGDGILGPTFSCIIARQFANTKHGDRFWYERKYQPKSFTPDQLSSIRSQALVSILCRVSEHTSFGFQPNPFLVETEWNAVMNCSSYNSLNLQPWKEQGCGEVYTSSNGVIKHPMYGGNYENNEDCVWKINAAEPIKITFVIFDLEANYDYLYIRNGPNSDSPLLASLTGSTNSNPVQTTQNSAYLQFSTDNSVTRTGFELRWEPASTAGSSNCACGQVNRANRIVNGVETEVNEYPWQAVLVYSGRSELWCGGSVISSKHVLTAAHCTEGWSNQDLQVLVGAHQLSSPASSQIRMDIARFIDHSSYNTDTYDNDISIIELSGSIDFSSSQIRPICLPDNDASTYDSVTATVSGWGKLVSGGSSSDVLMEVDVPTMSNAKCSRFYAGELHAITDNMLCAAYDEGGKDSCQGDSGGPLFYNTGTSSIQIGVVSWGYGCADAQYPGVYARVTKYLPWISTITASGTTCSAA